MSHTATATNWNGKTIRVEFKFNPRRVPSIDELAKKAHAAFEKAGFTTIRLDSIDNELVPYALAY